MWRLTNLKKRHRKSDKSIYALSGIATVLVVIAVIVGMKSCSAKPADSAGSVNATKTPVVESDDESSKETVKTHKVSYVTEDGTITETFEEGTSYALLALSGDEYKTFKGWRYSNDLDGNAFTALDPSVDSDVVLEPVYEAKSYSITYNLNGGQMDKQQLSYTAGKAIEIGTPVKDGCDFYGWFTDEGLTEEFGGITDKTTGDITLYASWSTSIYDDCDGVAKQIKDKYGVSTTYTASKAVYALLQDIYGQLNAYSDKVLSGTTIALTDGKGYGLNGSKISLGVDNENFDRDLHAMMFRKIDGNDSSDFEYEFGLYPTHVNDEAKKSSQRDAEMIWGYALTTGLNNSDLQMKWSVLYGLYGTALR